MKRNRCSAFGRPVRRRRLAGRGGPLGVGVLAATIVAAAVAPVRAQVGAPTEPSTDVPSSECCLVLLLPVGARAVSLGRTLAARGSPDAAFANPAGLASLVENHVVVHHSSTVAGQANAFSVLLTPNRIGTVGLSYQLFDYGEIEVTDRTSATTGVLSLRDHVVVGSFATSVYAGLSGGLNLKLYRSRTDCRGACIDYETVANTQAVDAGVHFQPGWLPWVQMGAAITNLGPGLQVENARQSDPLPARIQLGVAYEMMHHVPAAEGSAMWLSLEVIDSWHRRGSPRASLGAEFAAGDAVFLRAGYVLGEGIDSGTAVGVGVNRDRLTIAVSKSLTGSVLDPEQEPFQVSFGFRF